MSTAALKAAATGTQIAKSGDKPKTIHQFLETYKSEIARALPKHMTADRMARIALTEFRKNPALMKCDPATLFGAVIQCAQLGLEPGGALGHAFLLPFENRRKGTTEVQFIIGYRGMIDLALRSGQILSLEARAVYEADKFHVSLGLNPDLTHEPAWHNADRGALTFVYAVAKLRDGGVQFEVMSRAEIEKVRAQSKAGNSGPWVTHFEEMAKKTVIRRLFKYLPVSVELQRAVALDEAAEAGISQDNGLVIDGTYAEVETTAQDAETPAAVADSPAPWTDPEKLRADLLAAPHPDTLDLIADEIRDVEDAALRDELYALYRQRREEIAK